MVIKDNVLLEKDHHSETVMFENTDTPSEVYSVLTEAVEQELAKHDRSLTDDKFSSGDILGTAVFNKENEEVKVHLYNWAK